LGGEGEEVRRRRKKKKKKEARLGGWGGERERNGAQRRTTRTRDAMLPHLFTPLPRHGCLIKRLIAVYHPVWLDALSPWKVGPEGTRMDSVAWGKCWLNLALG
jgi:hypothetical protein